MGFIRCCFRLRCQTVCKPGSVPPRVCGGDGHSSGTFVAERLARPTRAAARQARPAAPEIVTRDAACRSYLVLLPVGFALPPPLPAARCALTAPFHPCRPCRPMRPSQGRRTGLGGVFLWHFPWGRPRRALPGTVPPWSPDFPPSRRPQGRTESGHPTVWHGTIWDALRICKPAGESRARRPTRSNSAPDTGQQCRLTADLLPMRRKTGPGPAAFAARHPMRAWLGPDPCGDSAHRAQLSMLHSAAAPGWPGPRRKADGV